MSKNLIDQFEQLSFLASGQHSLDDRRENAYCFVYLAELEVKTCDWKELSIVRCVLRHEHRRGALRSFWIFRFEISTREHRDELVVFFMSFYDALQNLGCFIGRASRD